MEQQGSEQNDLKDFDDLVGAHEVAEGVVPGTAIVAQDAQVGTGMEQQEDAQENAEQRHDYLLGDGMYFREVHIGIISKR